MKKPTPRDFININPKLRGDEYDGLGFTAYNKEYQKWQDKILADHKEQTGFFAEIENETMHTLTELNEYFKTLKKMRETKDPVQKRIYKEWLEDYLREAKTKD